MVEIQDSLKEIESQLDGLQNKKTILEEKTSSFGNLETERLKISKGGSDLQALEGEIARHKNQRAIASDNIISLEKKIAEETDQLKKYQENDTDKEDFVDPDSDNNEHQLLFLSLIHI